MKKLFDITITILALICLFGHVYAETLPIDGCTTLSGWYYEKRIYGRELKYHAALDISANRYTPIRAVKSGTVINADYSETLGNYMDVMDDTGFYRYAHLQNYKVVSGWVNEGQVIASVGNTGVQPGGRKMGSHLHLQRYENGKAVYFTDRFLLDGNRVYWSIRK